MIATKAERFEALRNDVTGEERYVFKLSDLEYVVVKYFDPVQMESASVKWFIGSYPAVRGHWRTMTVFGGDDVRWAYAQALGVRAAVSLLALAHKSFAMREKE